jgi:glutamate-5-semialdehyde dehydrogenase
LLRGRLKVKDYVKRVLREARKNSFLISGLNSQLKNNVLKEMARLLVEKKDFILKENETDIKRAKKIGLKRSFIDRLALNDKRIKEMSSSLAQVALLPDPVNTVIAGWQVPSGLSIQKVRVPIGVVLIIYEARPNVTSDCIGLCFKSSNIAILRGGKDAINSNKAIFKVLSQAVKSLGVKFQPFFMIERTSHKIVDYLLAESEYIDVVIPRGGQALIKKVTQNSSIPVIKHYKGVCHIFVDEFADIEKALKICINAKVQRPSVCNAVETILIHRKIAKKFLPKLKKEFDRLGVIIKGDFKARKILKGLKLATVDDWYTEYLDLIVSIKVVDSIQEAIQHINFYGSHHTDSIITQNINHANRFTKEVDSACCFVNISTRFSDGYQFGLGAEIGISTDKLHARGPMGLEDLTTYKYIVYGNGQIRE